MKEEGDLIIELPKFVPESFCKCLIDRFEKESPKRAGTVMYGGVLEVVPELKKSIESGCLCCQEGWEHEFKELSKFIRHAVELYKYQLYNEYYYDQPKHALENVIHSTTHNEIVPVIQKQSKGCKYAWRYDETGDISGSGKHFVTLMIYLNTLEPNEGGCTEFGNGRKVRPECGKIVMWPATWAYPHNGNEVIGDAKYTIVTPIFINHS